MPKVMIDTMGKFFFIVLFILLSLLPCPLLRADDTIDRYINGMTLKQKVGQMLMIGFQGKDLNEKDIAHIKNIKPGGVILYRRNFNDASDIPHLIAKIQSIIPDKLPIFFAVDQEGWIVHRIRDELYTPPSAPALGVINSAEISREVGFSVGAGLRELGININFAPVLDIPADILISPMTLRSFGNNLRVVESMGIAYIEGIRESGILSSAKHFPGIGRTHEDTHYTIPRIKWRKGIEKEHDTLPFASAIEAGVDIMMPGHVIAEPGDAVNPITLSSYWMTDVLRKEMGFKGLIIVDNIEMKPITDNMAISEAAIRAFNAGADIIMVSHEQRNQKVVFDALLSAIQRGEISNERLEQSLRRIFDSKKRLLDHKGDHKGDHKPARNLKELSRMIAENVIVDIRRKDAVDFTIGKDDRILYAGNNPDMITAIKDYFNNAEILDMPLQSYEKRRKEPVQGYINRFDAAIIDVESPDYSNVVHLCKKLGIKHIVVLRRPGYSQLIINRLQPGRIIILYETTKTHLQVALEIMSGSIKAKGRLPYNFMLPENYNYLE
jgi:beta-N-acetylhexosaminidase